MLVVFAGNWWVLAIRCVIALLFGVVAFLQPGVALTALALLFAAYALLDGILSLLAAYWRASRHDRWWRLAVEGVAGIAVAVVTAAWPAITVLALLYLVAAWAVVTGLLEVSAAIQLRRYLEGEWLLAVAGAVSILFGLLLMIAPIAGQIVLAWWIGGYALFFGVMMLVLAAKLRRWLRAFRPQLV
jgi:uncharacterized membrane protein HdeD (DUF308 family)